MHSDINSTSFLGKQLLYNFLQCFNTSLVKELQLFYYDIRVWTDFVALT